jgi:transposase-like protein
LFLDALTVKVRYELKAKKEKLLVAYGICSDGRRYLISYQRANSESYACWKAFLENLHVRGLKGRLLKLLVMDGAVGLWGAVQEVYPLVAHQLCWVHKLRNVSGYCPVRYRQECVRQAAGIMYAPSAGIAAKRFRTWRQQWQDKIPKAVASVEREFDRLIPVFEFPEPMRKIIRTTNVIERCFGEVRRRLKVMGYFHNGRSCDRIVYALFDYFNTKWQRETEKIKQVGALNNEAA